MRKAKPRDRPKIMITPEMIEAAVNEIIAAGVLWERCPNKSALGLVMTDVIKAALGASGECGEIVKSPVRDQ